ncbi:MAG: sulfotransferase [Pararhodobacter sp.]|nr:sulfotransferase [Pararhodobacter sp.]
MDSYIICATPRTGSTLLCELLTITRVAGQPDSFFMQDPSAYWQRVWGLPGSDGAGTPSHATAFLAAAKAAGRGDTPVFGLRLMHRSLGRLLRLIDLAHPGLPDDRARLHAAFGKTLFIHLSRGDKLAQAVSRVKARQTGLWHQAPDGTEIERLSPPAPPHYDHARIAATLAELERADTAWNDWFAVQRIKPLRVSYEALAADPAVQVARICTALGQTLPQGTDLTPPVAVLADDTNADWIARFRIEQVQTE